MKYVIPDFVVDSLVNITPEDIRTLSPTTRAVCMDIDGTITDYHASCVGQLAKERIRKFSDAGFLTFIISNCYSARVKEVHDLFDGLVNVVVTPLECLDPSNARDAPRKHRKPNPDMFYAAAAKQYVKDPLTGLDRPIRTSEMLMIGDQIFKDVLSARRAGALSVLLPRLGKHDHPGVRIFQRPVEFVLRAALKLPLRSGDWPTRLARVATRGKTA